MRDNDVPVQTSAGSGYSAIRNCMMLCGKCGHQAPELEWDEVWSHKQGGFVATCCPSCRSVGTSRYTSVGDFDWTRQVSLHGLSRLLFAMRLNLGTDTPITESKLGLCLALLHRWREWARAHGHLAHCEGIAFDTAEVLRVVMPSPNPLPDRQEESQG